MTKARMVSPLQIMMREDLDAWMVASYSYCLRDALFWRVRDASVLGTHTLGPEEQALVDRHPTATVGHH